MINEQELQKRLDEAAKQYNVPGASLAVIHPEGMCVATTGVANIATGQAVTPATMFASGSIGKVFTGSLIARLVDEGLVDLDTAVQHYLPEFRMEPQQWAERVTVRMLLDHTSGLPGNFTPDITEGPDVLARFVEALGQSEFVAEPGSYWSYCNAGLAVAGRVAEAVTGVSYDVALSDRILAPLGGHATTDPERMLLGSVAVGHLVDPTSGEASLPPQFRFSTMHGPAGTTLWLDIHALAAFARMHLEAHQGKDTSMLSAQAAQAMARPSVDLPWGSPLEHFGQAWGIRDTEAGPVLFHSGANIGCHSVLWVIPHRQAAVALLTNGTTGAALQSTLVTELLSELFDLPPQSATTAPAEPWAGPVDTLVGTYVADQGQAAVAIADGQLQLTMTYDPHLLWQFDMMGIPQSHTAMPLTAVDSERFVAEAAPGMFMPVVFHHGEAGSAQPSHVHVGRLFRRAM